MSSVIRKPSQPSSREGVALPRARTVVGVVLLGAGLWLAALVARELFAVVSDPAASSWLQIFRELPPEARTIGTPEGEYRIPGAILQTTGIVLLAVFLYCLTSLTAVILRIGGWMLRDDAEDLLKKIREIVARHAGEAGKRDSLAGR